MVLESSVRVCARVHADWAFCAFLLIKMYLSCMSTLQEDWRNITLDLISSFHTTAALLYSPAEVSKPFWLSLTK